MRDAGGTDRGRPVCRRHVRGRWRRGVTCLPALALAVTLTASCGELFEPTAPASPASPGAAAGSALEALDALPVAPEDNSPPYDRDAFGAAWEDVDGNGCDTRNDILARDLTGETTQRDGCTVLTGQLDDPYTGDEIPFNRERAPSAVQIDHVISLSDAWKTGASEWTEDKRIQFANDPENLLAVDGPENQSKSDDDAAEWLPPVEDYQCPFIARQVGLKTRYGLWVEPEEKEAMRAVLVTCPDQPVLGN